MTSNKIRTSCARVKIKLDFGSSLPKYTAMKIIDEVSKATRGVKVRIKYDFYPNIAITV